jgi:membrane protein
MNSDPRTFTSKVFRNLIQITEDRLRKIKFPGSKGLSAYEVLSLYIKGLSKGSLNMRATSIAFNFMLALGPAVIFILGIIPYLPFGKFQVGLMDVLIDVIPKNSYEILESILDEVFLKRSGLPIFGFILTLFFMQKGLNGIIEAFHATYHTVGSRSWFARRLISMGLLVIIFLLITAAVMLLLLTNVGVRHLHEIGVIKTHSTYALLLVGKWIIVLALTFMVISFLYYLAPAHKTKWRLFTPGSVMATTLSILTSMIFSYFVNHYAPFNRFFGSIGTVIAIMLWMNFNAIALLAGFELNATIKNARFLKLEPSVI